MALWQVLQALSLALLQVNGDVCFSNAPDTFNETTL
ncbi:MAG: hypothetical protein JWQ54_1671 [Mucilaginibacter sp.]|nr:hypothetical protein [Mucilaginibacter sp.]